MSLFAEPPELDFGCVPATNKPYSVDFALFNEGMEDATVNFAEISSPSSWFTANNAVIKEQRLSGFNIFFGCERLTTLTIPKLSRVEVSFVMVPTLIGFRFPMVLSIPYTSEDKSEPGYLEVPISGQIAEVSFMVSPRVLFLNDCCKGQTQGKSFQIKNTCEIELPIMVYAPEDIQIDVPGGRNLISVAPYESLSLTLHHTPNEIGQFEHKIFFECLLNQNSDATTMRLMTSVSPAEIPANFPTISVPGSEIDFGELNAGMTVESSFVLTNPGDKRYSVTIIGVVDIFSANYTSAGSTSSSSCVLSNGLAVASAQMKFRSAMSPKKESSLGILLQPRSAVEITADYTPGFHLAVDPSVFEQRTFMLTLTFVDEETGNTYFRRIKCKASVCHSVVYLSQDSVDFGDTTVGQTEKTATVTIYNKSPLKTVVKASPSSSSIVVPPAPIEIEGHASCTFSFTFYPKKINPEFTASIKFTNVNNPSNEVHLAVSAIVVAAVSEAVHSMSYSLIADGQHATAIDFQYCPMNYPTIKSFTIKNRTNGPLVVRFSSSSPEEIGLYQEEVLPISLSMSAGSMSNSALVFQASSMSDAPSFQLLNASSPQMSVKQLEGLLKTNSSFYQNLFLLLKKYSESELVEHFQVLLNQIEAVRAPGGPLVDINEKEIEIPAMSREEIFVFLVPTTDDPNESLLWKHRSEKMYVQLVGPEQVQPLSIPLLFNVAQSSVFLSSHSLNFGTIHCNSRHEHNIYMLNQSALPLLYKFESDAVTFDKKSSGIVYPLSSYSIPFSLITRFDGRLKKQILVRNVLNPKEVQTIKLKGRIVRLSNFFLDPNELHFGDVSAGSSSQRIMVFLTNTLTTENEITLSHVQKEILTCKPLISYQLKNMNSRRLTESMRLQIEKLECKLRCLQRKKKHEYAAQVKCLIDNLSKTTFDSTATQLKQMNAKYMERITFRIGPLQMVCIEFQLIPSVMTGKRLSIDIPIEGAVFVYEHGRTETQKMIRYKAHIIPEAQRLLDTVVQKAVIAEPSSIQIDNVFVHECVTRTIKIRNISNTQQNFWISSDSGNDCIITSSRNEGQLKTQEEQEFAIDVFCLQPGTITKQLAITTQTTTQTITFQITAQYKKVLEFPGLPENQTIDFGNMALNSLQVIEERSAFNILNVTDTPFYVSILNNRPKDILVYEQDPRVPQIKPFCLPPHASVRMNILMQPEIDPITYRKYTATLISGTLTIKAFDTEEEAAEAQNASCLFASQIFVKAAIGRIGLSLSDILIDCGSVKKEPQNVVVSVKNRSSHIPVEILTACTQGLSVDPQHITLQGYKVQKNGQDLNLTFRPSADGLNEAKLQLSVSAMPSQYQKTINVVAFVDPGIITTNLPKSSKQIDVLVLGPVYITRDKPIKKSASIQLTNNSNMAISFQIENKRMTIGSRMTQTFSFMFPFSDNFYDPEQPKFSYRLDVKSLTTGRILKIIDVIGEFVVSMAAITTETINFGIFGRINNWKYESKCIQITNKSNIDLSLGVSCPSGLLKLPPKIDGVAPLSDLSLKLVPVIENCEEEGEKTATVIFTNRFNPENVFRCSVVFDIRHSFLQFGRVGKCGNDCEVVMHKFTHIVDNESDKGGFYTANNWLSITNRLDDECAVTIETEELMENVHIEWFLRNTEVKVDTLDFQPNETIEVRVKAIVQENDFEEDKRYHFARVHFKSEGVEPMHLNVIFLATSDV